MITLTTTQLHELQRHLDSIQDIINHLSRHPQPATTILPRPKRKKTALRLTTATFTYRWLQTEPQRITRLYQYLLRAGWIAADTKPDDFQAIFSGNESGCKIRWTGKKTCLVYLFRLLIDRQYITIPNAMGRWVVVSSHFTDSHNRLFTHLNSQRIPLKAKNIIDQLAEGLNADND